MTIHIGNQMPDFRFILIAAISAFIIGATSTWWITASYKENKYKAIISQMRLDAAGALADATKKSLDIERENNRLAVEIEVQNAENRKKLDDVHADNLRLADELGGLYDRYSTCSSNTTKPNPATTTEVSATARIGGVMDIRPFTSKH